MLFKDRRGFYKILQCNANIEVDFTKSSKRLQTLNTRDQLHQKIYLNASEIEYYKRMKVIVDDDGKGINRGTFYDKRKFLLLE